MCSSNHQCRKNRTSRAWTPDVSHFLPRFVLSVSLCLVCLSCSDMILYRSGEEYFPLVQGSEWKYAVGNDTTYVQVAGDSIVANRTCIVVNVNYSPQFWYRVPTQVRRFFRHTVSRGGIEYVLEERYGLVYVLPLVTGSSWAETFQDTAVILGSDTIAYLHRLEARVVGVEKVGTPAGSFGQCYRLDFTEEVRSLEAETTYYSEWLAPGVGVVRRSSPAGEELLAEYRIGP